MNISYLYNYENFIFKRHNENVRFFLTETVFWKKWGVKKMCFDTEFEWGYLVLEKNYWWTRKGVTKHFASLVFWHFSVLPWRERLKEVVIVVHSWVFPKSHHSIFLFLEGFPFSFLWYYWSEVTKSRNCIQKGRGLTPGNTLS